MNPLDLVTAKALLETKSSRVRLLLSDASVDFRLLPSQCEMGSDKHAT